MRYRYILIILLGLCCMGMGKKKPALNIRFYTQTAQGDTDSLAAPVTLLNGQQTYIDQIAQVSERDIVSVYPDLAPDGSGKLGMKLNDHGRIALDSLSVEKRGTLLIATINGKQIADILIDQRVTDGVLTIPGGIQTADMKMILDRYPITGGKKASKKKDVYSVGM